MSSTDSHLLTSRANPLLQDWQTLHGLPPFDRIEPGDFEPALRAAMQQHRDELRAITENVAAPDFDNTVAAFDRAGRRLARVAATFYSLTASATNDALQAVQRRVAAPMAAHHSAVYTDEALFKRLQAVMEAAEPGATNAAVAPDGESLRLLQRVHLDFVRAGALLAAPQRQRHAEVMQELARLTTGFAQNVLHDESTWILPLQNEAALAGLPEYLRANLRQVASERGLEGHAVVLSRSSVMPFLAFSERRDLREEVWRAWVGRGEHAGEHDNREVARDILRLRNEQARLHGKTSYADHALTDTMAGSQQAVRHLLDEVWPRALKAVERERTALLQVMQAEGCIDPLEAWDWSYWAEKVRRQQFAVDDAEIKPYFALENVVQAAFDCAGRLFGLRFTKRDDLPVYHPDVAAYEVADAAGEVVGVFLQDNPARPGKRSGAWMNALRWQNRNGVDSTGSVGGARQLPVILNNNNFARGAVGQPTLLSLDDARTLFHEFGHGLHGLLSNVRFDRLSGTQVLRDFVELPSQIFEHWINEAEVLRRHARHWQTGEPMPAELMERMQRARRFNQGYETVRYTASAIADLSVHGLTDAEPPADLCAFEAELLQRAGLPHGVGQNHRLVHFQHLFAGSSYAAGYYVYLWAEVLDADGFDAFAEAGSPFDAAVAQRLLRHVYAAGNSVEPGAAFAAFRGRAPLVQPLLKKRGLMQTENA
ncbi:MAG: M3 family metallopeptidase [Rubrivivax sp.]